MTPIATDMEPYMRRRPEAIPYLHDVNIPGFLRVEGNDGAHSVAIDPAVTSEQRASFFAQAFKEARESAAEALEDITKALKSQNAIGILRHLITLENLSRHASAAEVFGYDAAVEMFAGMVTSQDASSITDKLEEPTNFESVLLIDQLLRRFVSAEHFAVIETLPSPNEDPLAHARVLLTFERQLDRTAGYNQHLQRIIEAVFEPLASAVKDVFGFHPLDAIQVADAVAAAQDRTNLAALEDLRFPERQATDRAERLKLYAKSVSTLSTGPLPTLPELIKDTLDCSAEVAIALLDALATPLGSQSVTSLNSENRLRLFPVIRLSEGEYFWPKPLDFRHVVMEWFEALCSEGSHSRLLERYFRARARATEELTSQVLADLFTPDRVFTSIEFETAANSWAEADAVVSLPEAAIVVEAKGHRMTAAGRRGARRRVTTKYDELVLTPIRQAQRAQEALLAGSRARRKGMPGKLIPLPQPSEVAKVVVTLDRVDPFATFGSRTSSNTSHDVWIVALANLLMVADILPTPEEFFTYATTRGAQAQAGSPIIYMESDALGAWLRSREGAWPQVEGEVFQLAYSSDDINRYFTLEEIASRHSNLGGAALKPSSGIPSSIHDLLLWALNEDHPLWLPAAKSVCSLPPGDWRQLDLDLRRFSDAPRSRSGRKARARIERGRIVGPLKWRVAAVPNLSVEDGVITLTVTHTQPI